MSTRTRHDVIDMEKGTLDRRIFTDADIYQEELEKVFGLAWLMVSHESLIPNPMTSSSPTWARIPSS